MEGFIRLELIKLNITLNLSRPITESFIGIATPLILRYILESADYDFEDDDRRLTLLDLRFIFDNGRLGEYGEIYGGIGCDTIRRWIDKYKLSYFGSYK